MNIPKVEKGKIVVIRSDYNTGKILNIDGSFYNSCGNEYYEIAVNIEEAKKIAKKEICENNKYIQILLYNDEAEFIEVITPDNVEGIM